MIEQLLPSLPLSFFSTLWLSIALKLEKGEDPDFPGVPATMSALKCGACSSKPGSLGERVLGGVPCAAGRGEEGELAGASPELAASPHPCWSKISHPHI